MSKGEQATEALLRALNGQSAPAEKSNRKRDFVSVTIQTGSASSRVVELEPPDACPVCRTSCSPHFVGANAAILVGDGRLIQACFRCPRHSCGCIFIGYFLKANPGNDQWVVERVAPATFADVPFAEAVVSTSPSFVRIYNQALRAELLGLDELCGIGLRKSLEFLVKDFCKSQHPTEAQQIEKRTLADCIKTYIVDENIKRCAERAAWLGNDETHYVRLWEEKDIQDLKRLVHLTANWIDNTILTQRYLSEMPEGRR